MLILICMLDIRVSSIDPQSPPKASQVVLTYMAEAILLYWMTQITHSFNEPSRVVVLLEQHLLHTTRLARPG